MILITSHWYILRITTPVRAQILKPMHPKMPFVGLSLSYAPSNALMVDPTTLLLFISLYVCEFVRFLDACLLQIQVLSSKHFSIRVTNDNYHVNLFYLIYLSPPLVNLNIYLPSQITNFHMRISRTYKMHEFSSFNRIFFTRMNQESNIWPHV